MTPTPSGWIQSLTLTPPSLADNTADADRLRQALGRRLDTNTANISVDLSLLRRLPQVLRSSGYAVRCLLLRERRGWRVLDIFGSQEPGVTAGVAIDLGTTRVALRMLDLCSGVILGETDFINPQVTIGPDILTRIHAAATPEGLERLNRLIIEGLNRAIADMCAAAQLTPANVYMLTVAGNTAMTHLFLKLPVRWIIREPYIPAVNSPGILAAAALGLELNPAARVLALPNIGSYFGGDLIAGILHAGLHRREKTAMMVDVGTNAEVVLGNRHWLVACAGAAGPALEGGVTRMGMMAGPGVIDRVTLQADKNTFELHTIDDLKPVGICGSGLIDLAAGLFSAGWIDVRGKFVAGACGDRLQLRKGLPYLVVVPAKAAGTGVDLGISQADLDSLIRSKAAMYTILETLAGSVGIDMDAVETFYVAGTFGVFIDPEAAITIGMIPDLARGRFKPLGNSSLGGAVRLLQSPEAVDEIDAIRDTITYLELNVNQDFMNRFSAAKFLPHTDKGRFPSVIIP